MTLTFGFYDSSSGDRVYNAEEMGSIFDGIIKDGIFAAIGQQFSVLPNAAMQLKVGTGRAWFDHTWTYNDTDFYVTVPTADALLPRIDIVYLETDSGVGVRANKIDILEGTPGSVPVPPTLIRTATKNQYALAHIYVAATVTTIYVEDIDWKVGGEPTPWVVGPLATIDALLLASIGHEHIGGDGDPIPTAGLQDDAVTNPKLGPDAVDDTKLANVAVGTEHIQGLSVTESKIAAGAVTNTKLGALSIDAAKIQDEAVTADKIGFAAVFSYNIATGGVWRADIDSNAVDNPRLNDMAAYTIKGRAGTTAGDPNDIPLTTLNHLLMRGVSGIESSLVKAANITANIVDNSKLGEMAAYTVKGNPNSALGDPDDILLNADGHILRREGTVLESAFIEPKNIANKTRRLWISPIGTWNVTDSVTIQVEQDGIRLPFDKDVRVLGTIAKPLDYVSGTTVKAHFRIASGSGNCYCSMYATYGADGNPALNAAFLTSAEVPMTAPAMKNLSLALTAGVGYDDSNVKWLNIMFTRWATNPLDTVSYVYFVGFTLEYTADS